MNKKKASGFEVSGIKCDNCNYADSTVTRDDYDEYLNKPCPKCNENLLTEEDYELVKQLEALSDLIGTIEVPEDEPMFTLPIKMDGSGTLKLGKIFKKKD